MVTVKFHYEGHHHDHEVSVVPRKGETVCLNFGSPEYIVTDVHHCLSEDWTYVYLEVNENA